MSTHSGQSEVTRIYRSADQWREIIKEYGVSDLSQAQFCEQRNLSASSFYQWLKKCRDENNDKPAEKREPAFIEVSPLQPSTATAKWAIELELASGMVLRIRDA